MRSTATFGLNRFRSESRHLKRGKTNPGKAPSLNPAIGILSLATSLRNR